MDNEISVPCDIEVMKRDLEELKANQEDISMNEQSPEARMSYPIDAIQSGINKADKLAKQIGDLEQSLSVILLPEVNELECDDVKSEATEARSLLIEKANEMHRRLDACIKHLDKLSSRLDL